MLAVKYRITNDKGEMSGGPMYYIERGLNIKWLAMLFALFGVLASFGIGSSVQANSVAQAIQASFHVDPWITGAALTVLTAVVVLGGIQSISKATSFIVPFMAIVYVLGGLAIIFLHYDKVIPAVELICRSAFGLDAVVGGRHRYRHPLRCGARRLLQRVWHGFGAHCCRSGQDGPSLPAGAGFHDGYLP